MAEVYPRIKRSGKRKEQRPNGLLTALWQEVLARAKPAEWSVPLWRATGIHRRDPGRAIGDALPSLIGSRLFNRFDHVSQRVPVFV